MKKKGQIVEIPPVSDLYNTELPEFHSKRDEILWKSAGIAYSLFDGFIVGEHQGIENFRLGQRKGINVGGKKEPLYVIGIDNKENRLFVGAGDSHPGLFTKVIRLTGDEHIDFNISDETFQNGLAVEIAFNEGKDVRAQLYKIDGMYFLEFEEKVPITFEDHIIKIKLNNR
ncbi:tRNA methyl transferase PRC-barrel domain-containing protein [Epilithonimonas sp.]|uniref:tRNA methyl transferase PRC-barrel domain-containing protein n=1 Tax=Epilithonimonas sp. TaxID=2894511 RepID=UPI0035B172C4